MMGCRGLSPFRGASSANQGGARCRGEGGIALLTTETLLVEAVNQNNYN